VTKSDRPKMPKLAEAATFRGMAMQLLDYDKMTGTFKWKVRRGGDCPRVRGRTSGETYRLRRDQDQRPCRESWFPGLALRVRRVA